MDPQEVVEFWVKEVGSKGWYLQDDALDQTIRDRFDECWQAAKDHRLEDWQTNPEGVLAYLIVTDQFPRNMFRNDPRAFDTDEQARAAAKKAIHQDWDQKIAEPERQFFYLPMMHSECLTDQDRCVRLLLTSMPETGASNLLHARAHREIIRKFGRFPYRNAALSRISSDAEKEFLQNGGYAKILKQLEPSG